MNRREEIEAERQREAQAALARAERETETIGESGLGRAAGDIGRRLGGHFGASDADPDDRIELWGRRVARLLALAACIALAIHLARTYL